MTSVAGGVDDEDVTRQKLASFLTNVEEDLGRIVLSAHLWITDEEFIPLLIAAWDEAKPRFGQLNSQLNETSFQRLEERGLTGRQLDFKLAIYEKRRKEFYSASSPPPVSTWSGRIKRGILGKLADIIDTILQSLNLPGADLVGELKDGIKNLS